MGFGGEFIEAQGTFNGANTLTATEIEIEDESFDIDDADKAELEGIVITACGATAPCTFTMGGVTVQVDTATQYNLNDVTFIQPGVQLEAEGALQGGILIADEIEFK